MTETIQYEGGNVIDCPERCCSGCGMCTAICPISAIEMVKQDNGFAYPVIDINKCVHCNLCHSHCPAVDESMMSQSTVKRVYAFRSKDLGILRGSSSGGAFVHLSNHILKAGGVVYGAMFDESWNVVIGRAQTSEERDKFRGSKYVQSDASASYHQVKLDLEAGIVVLFSGAPCQVNALKTYLSAKEVDMGNLFTIDFICHGCPNPTLWHKHLKAVHRSKSSTPIRYVTFRKKNGQKGGMALFVEFENGKKHLVDYRFDPYYLMFLHDYILRPSCYSCRFSTPKREGDITLSDWWKSNRVSPAFNADNMGASAVMINTEKGLQLFSETDGEYEGFAIRLEDAMQPNMEHPSERPARYAEFHAVLKKGSLERAAWTVASTGEKVRFVLHKLHLSPFVDWLRNR